MIGLGSEEILFSSARIWLSAADKCLSSVQWKEGNAPYSCSRPFLSSPLSIILLCPNILILLPPSSRWWAFEQLPFSGGEIGFVRNILLDQTWQDMIYRDKDTTNSSQNRFNLAPPCLELEKFQCDAISHWLNGFSANEEYWNISLKADESLFLIGREKSSWVLS